MKKPIKKSKKSTSGAITIHAGNVDEIFRKVRVAPQKAYPVVVSNIFRMSEKDFRILAKQAGWPEARIRMYLKN